MTEDVFYKTHDHQNVYFEIYYTEAPVNVEPPPHVCELLANSTIKKKNA